MLSLILGYLIQNANEGGWLVAPGSEAYVISVAQQGVDEQRTNPYDGHSISLFGNLAFGGGFNFGIGVVWNNDGDWRIFGSAGPSFGVDASAGVAIKAITNNKREPFDPNQYAGWGSSHNIGIGVVDVVLIGGDNSPNFSTGTMGATYTESGGGVSWSFPPASYTYQTSYTTFIADWFK